MIPPNIHLLNSTLLALPVAAVLTRRLLQNHKSSALVAVKPVAENSPSVHQRAHSLAEKLKRIAGYSHFGLNE